MPRQIKCNTWSYRLNQRKIEKQEQNKAHYYS